MKTTPVSRVLRRARRNFRSGPFARWRVDVDRRRTSRAAMMGIDFDGFMGDKPYLLLWRVLRANPSVWLDHKLRTREHVVHLLGLAIRIEEARAKSN